MTTGEPVVVRAAMKPLPTLTKPLRSVDTETQAAGRGTARAHRLLHRAGGRGGRRGDGGARARRAYREKFGGDAMDDVLAALDAYKRRIEWRR